MGDHDRVSDALMSLRRDHRTAVIRAYYFGETLANIAAHEDIAEDMAKARLHYALQELRRALLVNGTSQCP